MNILTVGPRQTRSVLVLAHGAGAPMDSPFMETVASSVAAAGVRVVRFEFPYMAVRRTGGGRRPPDRESVLRQTWLDVIAELGGAEQLVIGGKSLGGRIASMVADDVGVRGLVCLGYPFHPAGRPDRLRTAHLMQLQTPALILQGERDPMGSRSEVESYLLSPRIRVQWLPDGDHSYRPRRITGVTEAESLQTVVEAVTAFVGHLPTRW